MSEEKKMTCVVCPVGCEITVRREGDGLKIKGFQCKQGKIYAQEEFENPSRTLTATVKIKDSVLPLLPVKSKNPLPREKSIQAMQELAKIEIKAPVKIGDTVFANISGTGIDMIATRSMPLK